MWSMGAQDRRVHIARQYSDVVAHGAKAGKSLRKTMLLLAKASPAGKKIQGGLSMPKALPGTGGSTGRACAGCSSRKHVVERIVRFYRGFFTFVFTHALMPALFRFAAGGVAGRPAGGSVGSLAKNILQRWLTVKKTVIRFRPADLSCGSE